MLPLYLASYQWLKCDFFLNVFLLQKLMKIAGNGSAVTERTEVWDLFV